MNTRAHVMNHQPEITLGDNNNTHSSKYSRKAKIPVLCRKYRFCEFVRCRLETALNERKLKNVVNGP